MAENNMISLKVFLRDEGINEARRFTVDASAVTSFIFMNEKLKTVFPSLRDAVFKITWKDSDGDEITVASDEDFITAFTEMNVNVKVLYVTIVQHKAEPLTIEAEVQEPSGLRIICDICNQLIIGFRYKCMQCPDYDLCSNCEHQGHHSDHLMMRVPNNDVYMPKCARKFMHHVARNLKKSAYFANKEAHRAAKYAHKFGGQAKCGANAEQEKAEQPSCSAQPKDSACAGDAINLDDIHALGALARQHFGPILDTLRNVPASDNNSHQEGLFMDIIRNAVDGFFGKVPEQTTEPQEREAGPSGSGSVNNGSTSQDVPMDVEATTANAENNSRDPGWTFVATKPRTEATANSDATQSTPSAPAFVYHENPKIAEGLVKLHEMGFSNETGYLTQLLERFHGNVNLVVKAIIDMKP